MDEKLKLIGAICIVFLVAGSVALYGLTNETEKENKQPLQRFDSCNAVAKAFSGGQSNYRGIMFAETALGAGTAAKDTAAQSAAPAYSETNVQVAGVDEADIVKTDGNYIYTTINGKLVIAKAWPAEDAEVLSSRELNMTPQEIFIDQNRLLIFGTQRYYNLPIYATSESASAQKIAVMPPYWRSYNTAAVQLWDITDRENPELIKNMDFEGNYVSSRKINSDVYFVINTYRYIYNTQSGEGNDTIVPLYKEGTTEAKPLRGCNDIAYFAPYANSFTTVAAISMQNEDKPVEKEVIAGSGQNVYASQNSIYIAETDYNYNIYDEAIGSRETTNIHKFALDNGKIQYLASGTVPGTILNQFSMDEHKGNFRIATTANKIEPVQLAETAVKTAAGIVGRTVPFRETIRTNNIYVLDENMKTIGTLEDLAPGESIYSARFMGDRAYLVTFKKVDPLFVIDLSNPEKPSVLGKLKIPGYSDYLHPYDENHIIGIGKEAMAAEQGDFAWYQGIKIAIFDVTDVENPKEMHKAVIGDRGTDSEALHDHKAFLFDKEKNLLVIPVTLAEINDKENAQPNSYGDFVWQGAYVYDITLENGFKLKGRITHHENDDVFKKSGDYYYSYEYTVRRALYIGDILYTLSNSKIKMNALNDVSEIKDIRIG